jgi:hypothetical protein
MATKANKLESTLVSMTGSVIYLHDLSKTLEKKPIVPQSVTELMPETQAQVASLKSHFERSLAVVRKEAQPFLDEWLAQQSLLVGGVFRGSTRGRTFGHFDTLTVEGGIEHAQLHRYLIDGTRTVDFTLIGARLGLPDGSVVNCVNDVPTTRWHFNLTALHDVVAKDPASGAEARTVHVRVPLQGLMRDRWARDGELELT